VGEVAPGIVVAGAPYIVAFGMDVAGIVAVGIVDVELAGSEPVAAVGYLWPGSHLYVQACMAIV
jgi:hypothetical protein